MKIVIRNIFTGFILTSFLSLPIVAQIAPSQTSEPDPNEETLPDTAETEAPEMTEEAEKAIERGLKFLISSQNKDGSWSSKDLEKGEGSGYAIGGTFNFYVKLNSISVVLVFKNLIFSYRRRC